jgi:predicted amidophosphoribosyltransferase
MGIRYRCTKRDNYDICEKCEATVGPASQFSFIKIRKPNMAPVRLMCQYETNLNEMKLDIRPKEQPPVVKQKEEPVF